MIYVRSIGTCIDIVVITIMSTQNIDLCFLEDKLHMLIIIILLFFSD